VPLFEGANAIPGRSHRRFGHTDRPWAAVEWRSPIAAVIGWTIEKIRSTWALCAHQLDPLKGDPHSLEKIRSRL